MTPEAQRIAIAEACGLIVAVDRNFKGLKCPVKHANNTNGALWVEGPDYFNDLNAMHEAEKILTDAQRKKYSAQLALLLPTAGWDAHSSQLFEALHATSAQRAEAFGRTLGLWT